MIRSGDVELNPGPNKSSSLTFFHWNLNGIAAHDFSKISLIQSHALSYNIDIIFLSETFLDSSIETNNPKLNIPGYNLLRSDHPSNIKRGGVCMFYKDYLPVIRRHDLCALTECIVVEVNSGTKSLFFTCNYRSPSQTVDEFESYCQSLHLTLTNIDDTSPFSSVLIGDFNARCTNWWTADIDSKAGKELDSLTSTAGYTQLIDKPTHFFSGGCSCIDLIFCNKPELISEYGIDHSLFQTCHHNLIFGKINAKIPVPPAYSREVWDYKNANAEGIQKSISRFNWKKAFENLSINEKVDLLNATLLNIFRNYIPNKIVKCSYRDPPWLTKLIKSKLKDRSKITKEFYRKGQDPTVFTELNKISSECSNLITNAKMGYIQKKSNALNDKNTDPKVYWTILNNFLNNIKIPSIPPILASGKTITNIVEKANLCNNFFASQCTLLENTSKLPLLLMKTDKRLNTISFKDSDITSIIKSLKPTKAHGADNISIRMIQLCGDSITLPLTLIFKFSLRNGIFPATWKMANIIPVHKKEEKHIVKNYRPISLLPIFAKIFERLLFNSLFIHFHDNDLFTKCQSGFMPGDSCISQLLSIVHEIQSSFDCNPPVDTRAIFLDISKAFNKV